jgi:hypothetical protein
MPRASQCGRRNLGGSGEVKCAGHIHVNAEIEIMCAGLATWLLLSRSQTISCKLFVNSP